jgi:CHAT domain-containing protein
LSAALVHIDKSIQASASLQEKIHLFEALGIRSQVLVEQGDFAAAAESLNQGFVMAEQVTEKDLVYAYYDLGNLYNKISDRCDEQKKNYPVCIQQIEIASANYVQAIKVADKLGWSGLSRSIDKSLKDLSMRKAMLAQKYQLDEMLGSSGPFKPKGFSNVLVTEDFAISNPELIYSIRPFYDEMKRRDEWAGGFADVNGALTLHMDGSIREAGGDFEGALAPYMKAVDLVERDRRKLTDEAGRIGFLESRIAFYHRPILVLLQERRNEEAFALLERSKGRAMADLLASRAVSLPNAQERDLFARSVELRSRIAGLQAQLFNMIISRDPQTEIAQISAPIQRLQNEHDNLTREMRQRGGTLQKLVVAESTTLPQLQQAMQDDRFELLQYLVQDHALILWHISAESVHVRNVFLPKSQLIQKVRSLQASLEDPNNDFDADIAKELYLFLFAPAREWIKSKRLVIIPQDELHHLSFEALIDSETGQALGENYQISYAPSATLLLNLKRPGDFKGAKLLAVADPGIPQASAELDAIAAVYPGRNKTVRDALATEAEVKSSVGGYDVVHLSVHGDFNVAEPLLSNLRLAPGGGDDGKLTAAEMFGLPLANKLVVLSACETSKAQVTHGDEIIGMQRALLYAGAGSLVLSRWKVDAASAALWMQTFYHEAEDQPLAEAARRAVMVVKSKSEYRHPYHWAAFSLVSR